MFESYRSKNLAACESLLSGDAVGVEFKLPSVRLVRAAAAIGGYLETAFASSSPLALCQQKHVKADAFENVASLRINRRESGGRSVANCVAANCGPAGMKPAETLWVSSLETNRWQERKLCKLRRNEFCSFSIPDFCVVTSPAGDK